jgi:hypothetical protein
MFEVFDSGQKRPILVHMPDTPFDFDALLSPIGVKDFFSTYWERKHLVLRRGQPGYYQSLMMASDLETLISDSDARYPAIRLAKGGGYYPREAYARDIKHGDETFFGVAHANAYITPGNAAGFTPPAGLFRPRPYRGGRIAGRRFVVPAARLSTFHVDFKPVLKEQLIHALDRYAGFHAQIATSRELPAYQRRGKDVA